MIDRSIPKEAVSLIAGDRNNDYGPPEDGLLRVARLWSAYMGQAVTVSDVAKLLLLMKVARTMGGYKRDNFVDGVAYLLIAEGLDHGPTD